MEYTDLPEIPHNLGLYRLEGFSGSRRQLLTLHDWLTGGDDLPASAISGEQGMGKSTLASAVAWKTEPGQRFFVFAREAGIEAKKVVWPTRKETMQTTGAVFAFVVVMAVFLYLTDKSLEWVLYDLVLGWKKS